MMNMQKYALIMMSCLALAQNLQAVVIGSNTAVSLQGLALFPAADTDNEARGFAAFAGGIQLQDHTTTCIYSSQFPMGTMLALHGGKLVLQTDLVCASNMIVEDGGTIEGNSFNWEFTGAETVHFPTDSVDDTDLSFITSINPGSAIASVDWSYDNQYVLAVAGSTLFVYSFNGTSLSLATSIALGGAGNSGRWHPSSYYIATACGGGNDIEVFLFTPPSTLASISNSGVFTGNGTAVAWHPTGNWLAGGSSAGTTNQFKIWPVTAGVLGTITQSTQDPISNNALSWRSTYTYIAIGVSTSPQLRVLSYDGTTIVTNATSALGAGQTVAAVDYSPTNSFIAVGLSGGTQRFRVYQHDPVAGTLTLRAALTDSNTVNSVQWSTNGNHILVGRTVGTTYELMIYEFNQQTYDLSTVEFANSTANVLSARFSPNQSYATSAGYNSANAMAVFDAVQLPDERIFQLQNVHITVPSYMHIHIPMIMQGDCSIYANFHTLHLAALFQAGEFVSSGSLAVDANSLLELGQLTLAGLGTHNLYCMDNTGTLELENMTLVLDDDFTFDQGTLIISGDVTITGTHSFIYASSQPLIIEANSCLCFDSGTTFKYAPSSAANDLIQMEDYSAKLHLYETTLQTTTTGLKLTTGSLVVEGLCPVVSAATSQAQGVLLGDGVSAANNITLTIFPESNLAVQSGYVVYQNV